MRVVFLMDHDDGHKKGKNYFLEPTLGRRLCDNGVTIPYVTHLKNLEIEKEAMVKAKAKAKADKEAKNKAKAKKLLENREKAKTTTSKKANARSKAVKY